MDRGLKLNNGRMVRTSLPSGAHPHQGELAMVFEAIHDPAPVGRVAADVRALLAAEMRGVHRAAPRDETLKVPIQHTYDLAQAPDALQTLGATHTQGKLALRAA
jgi:hypothetical protein